MKVKDLTVRATGLVLILAIAGLFSACGKKDSAGANKPQPMIVVFATGDVKVMQAGKENSAKIGLIVNESDEVKTGNGTIDLQTKGGSAVRIREFTTVKVAKLTGSNTNLSMSSGSLLATVKKENSSENFEVVTPTAIAGVRGTTFSVEVEDGREPRVKVLEGKVAMAPRVAALDNYSKEEIEKDKTLKSLSDISLNNEVVIEANQEGTIDPKVEATVFQASQKVQKAQEEKKSVESAVSAEAVAHISSTIKDAKKENAVQIKEVEITPQEKAEKETLVTIDSEVLQKVIDSGENTVAVNAATEAMVAQRNERQEKILQKIEEEASKSPMKSEAEIKKHYEKLELIILKNGEKLKGAVIAQTGTLLVIHTPEGVKRIEKDDVNSQEFLY